MPVRAFSLVLVLGLAAGCGSPQDACEDFISTTCRRLLECVSAANTTQSECVSALSTNVQCSQVVDTSDSFGTCMERLEGDSCAVLFPNQSLELPAACRGALLFE